MLFSPYTKNGNNDKNTAVGRQQKNGAAQRRIISQHVHLDQLVPDPRNGVELNQRRKGSLKENANIVAEHAADAGHNQQRADQRRCLQGFFFITVPKKSPTKCRRPKPTQ